MYELAGIFIEQKKFGDALFFAKSAYSINPANEWYAQTYAEVLPTQPPLHRSRRRLGTTGEAEPRPFRFLPAVGRRAHLRRQTRRSGEGLR